MFAPPTMQTSRAPGEPPLTFPQEVWDAMSSDYRAACESAQKVLDSFGEERTLGLRDVRKRAVIGLDEALRGLEVLDGMDLVAVEASDTGPRITLRAIPDGHVRITGLDGKVRWVFIARPLDAPEVAPQDLN
jgi:hypothetical protein